MSSDPDANTHIRICSYLPASFLLDHNSRMFDDTMTDF